jgi:hypothetical protein
LALGLGANLALARFAPGVSWLWWNPAGFAAAAAAALLLSGSPVRLRRPAWPRRETRWLLAAFVAMLATLVALPGLLGMLAG